MEVTLRFVAHEAVALKIQYDHSIDNIDNNDNNDNNDVNDCDFAGKILFGERGLPRPSQNMCR